MINEQERLLFYSMWPSVKVVNKSIKLNIGIIRIWSMPEIYSDQIADQITAIWNRIRIK